MRDQRRAVLSAYNLSIKVRGQYLFQNISFDLFAGEVLIIEGENGTGKTSLLKTLLGLSALHSGSVHLNLPKSAITYLPQSGNTSFFIPLTLGDVIQLDSDIQESEIIKWQLQSPSALKKSWNTASGGEKQKALLARAIAQASQLLVLDEPFNHLDKESKIRIVDLIESKSHEGAAILMVAHENINLFKKARRLALSKNPEVGDF